MKGFVRIPIVAVLCVLATQFVKAQTEVDVVRYSSNQVSGTARNIGIGGASTAIGGDLSVASYNPAGLGIMRSGELTVTPSLFVKGITTTHYGNEVYSSRPKLAVDNLGFAGPLDFQPSGKWKNFNIGVTYNKLWQFQQDQVIEGQNTQSSLLDAFTNLLTDDGTYNPNNPPSNYPFSADLAWRAYAINIDTANNRYFLPFGQRNATQYKRTEKSGSMDEVALSFAGNYDHKLYLGVTVGIVNASYTEQSTYEETVSETDTTSVINSFRFEEALSTEGTGVNLKLGALYRINDRWRIGGALHTPTSFFMSDGFEARFTTDFKNGDVIESPVATGVYEYKINTPVKAMLGVTHLFNKKGLISLDYEFMNYPGANLKSRLSGNYDFATENNAINNNLQATHNIRGGTEWRFGRITARAGYAFYLDPYRSNITASRGYRVTSFGLGYRAQGWYLDFAYQGTTYDNSEYYLYSPNLASIEPSNMEEQDFKVLLTFGLKY